MECEIYIFVDIEVFFCDFVNIFLDFVIVVIFYFGFNLYMCLGWIRDVKELYIKER